jgi:hypothetical protein
MERARRHQRALSILAFGLLALVVELLGRSLTHRIDVGRHVRSPGVSADYYPILLAAVKVGVALLLARLAWRVVKARAAARAARRVLAAVGSPGRRVPRVRLSLSPRLWLVTFLVTSLIYLVQTDAESLSTGRWPLLGPWLHSSALPIFAVLAVLAAFVWGVVQRWLADYESYAEEAVARAQLLAYTGELVATRPAERSSSPPRRLFGLSFESRPPPLAA